MRIAEKRPRAGGEILEARADPDDEVGILRQCVGARRAGDADRSHVERMVPGERRLAGLRLGDGDVVRFGEAFQRLAGAGIVHAAAGDDHRGLGLADRVDRLRKLEGVRRRAALMPGLLLKEAFRIVVGFRLDVLAEGERHRAAVGRIGQRAQRAGEGAQQLLRPRDAVEIAADGPEAVIGGDRAVAEILDLLQHGVGSPIGEDVGWNEEHRQAVHMRGRGGGDHVGGARPDG